MSWTFLDEAMKVEFGGLVRRCIESNLDFVCDEPEFLDFGQHKAVYKVPTPKGVLLAVAAALKEGHTFGAEYDRLRSLHSSAPELFPEAKGVFNQDDVDVLLMEYLPFKRVDLFKDTFPGRDVDIARAIGYATGNVLERASQVTREPHDGNILLRMSDDGFVEARFVDADHFRFGDISDVLRIYHDASPWSNRSECREYWNEFTLYVQRGVNDARGNRPVSFDFS